MKGIKTFTAVCCAALCVFSLPACNLGRSKLLGKPAKFTSLTYEEKNTEGFALFKDRVEAFACDFAESAYASRKDESNLAVSPVSVYMALSLAAECAGGQTREEILSALGVTHAQLKENFPLLYRSLAVESKAGSNTTGLLIPTNSIWVNDGTPVNQACIDALSEYYYAYSYSADFLNDNQAANNAVRKFVKDKTKGLIDKDFQFKKETLFTLINTLYLKTIWNDSGDDLAFWGARDFVQQDGTVKNTQLLGGYYNEGRAYKTEKFSSFFTQTYDGYKIKFIVPEEGYSVADVFTSENIAEINAITDYGAVDEENKIMYNTRCIFPEYECSYDNDIADILKEKFGIDKLFNDPGIFTEQDSCDFSSLTEEKCYCSGVKHAAKLIVDKKGIEGAAVTAVVMDGATGGPAYEFVYEDFFVDRAFGFIITDPYGVTLFSGAVNSL